MFQRLKKVFCIHIFEYEHSTGQGLHRECRKCGMSKSH